MLTSTGFDVFFAAAGNLYLLLMVAGVALAIWKGRTRQRKAVFAVLVVLLFIAPILPEVYRSYEHRQRYSKAKDLFDERCKTAGEKIYRTVDGVDGVRLMNLRTSNVLANRHNPMWEDAGLPQERTGEGYIGSFLLFENHDDKRSERGYLTSNKSKLPGYRYVDAPDVFNKIVRYRLGGADGSALESNPIPDRPARYAVSHVNMIDPADRAHWVAGTKVTVTDTDANEVLAEHVWYSFERGLGSTGGHRQPWGFAVTCPRGQGQTGATTRKFVDRVLKPMKEN